MSEGSEPSLDRSDLQNIFRNNHRRTIVRELYREPKKYIDLLRITGLKPGSIYHHLRILDSLVEKNKKGWYRLTEFGFKMTEELELSDSMIIKPIVNIKDKRRTNLVILREFSEDNFSFIWRGNLSNILLIYTLLIMLGLSFSGVAVAGSAMYVLDHPLVIIFDLVAFLMGLGILIIFENFRKSRNLYGSHKFFLFIRLMSSLPAVILGTALYLLFLLDREINPLFFPLIFVVTVLLGLLVSASGIYYLRNENWETSVKTMSVVILIDLLFGIAIFITD